LTVICQTHFKEKCKNRLHLQANLIIKMMNNISEQQHDKLIQQLLGLKNIHDCSVYNTLN